jgi:hypothetical protein
MSDTEEKQEKQEESSKPERDANGRLLPGNTANPHGRPKGISIMSIIRDKLGSKFLTDTDDITKAESMVDKYLKSIDGESFDKKAFEFLIEQIDGKATQTVVSVSDEDSDFVKAVKEIKEKLQNE